MKSPVYALIILILASCAQADFVVESDYSYHGSFNKYRSFYFGTNMSFSGSDNEKAVVENYLGTIMKSWGYDETDKKPDLVIFYTFYYDDLMFKGFEQPHFQGWLKANFADREIVFKKDTLPGGELEETYVVTKPASTPEDYSPVLYSLRQGTILVSLFDRKKRKTVWQGYASGVFGPNEDRNIRVLKSAIIRIMDEYKLLAFNAS